MASAPLTKQALAAHEMQQSVVVTPAAHAGDIAADGQAAKPKKVALGVDPPPSDSSGDGSEKEKKKDKKKKRKPRKDSSPEGSTSGASSMPARRKEGSDSTMKLLTLPTQPQFRVWRQHVRKIFKKFARRGKEGSDFIRRAESSDQTFMSLAVVPLSLEDADDALA